MAERAIEYWRALDLVGLQKDLDRDAEEIGKRRDEAELSRRELVETSQAFRAKASEDVRKAVAGIVKRFQTEVDMLSKRSKAAETAFLSVYQKLAVAPDPMPLIDAAIVAQSRVSATQELELTNQRLLHTIEEYRAEFADLKNQEVTVSRLKEELKKYEEKMEEAVTTRVREKEKQLQRAFAEKEREQHEQQLAMATKLGEAENAAATLRAALESTQSELYDMRAHHDEDAAARAAALDVLEREAEAAQQKVEMLRKELEIERERFETALNEARRTTGPRIDEISLSALEREVHMKDRELATLADDHRNLQHQFASFKQSSEARMAALDVVVRDRTQAVEALQKELSGRADYDDVKRELSMLKGIEFGSSGQGEGDRPLEVLLRERVRHLESDVVSLKARLAEATARATEMETMLGQAQGVVAEQQHLISMLEGDISSVKAVKGAAEPSAEELLTGGNVGALTDTILPIVASQRDRFKSRNVELEAETRHQQQTITSLRNEIDGMRQDNVKLYEKIKFLQGYHPTSVNVEGEEVVRKYSPEYEEHINPFRAFNAKEKQRKYQNLNPAERLLLHIMRTILASAVGRLCVLAYLIILHALIFLVLYKYSHTEACKREAARVCVDKFSAHMNAAHHEALPHDIFEGT